MRDCNGKLLFLTKQRTCHYATLSSGLFNSVAFVVQALRRRGFDAEHRDVVDGNEIDRHVTRLRPSRVYIDALWVTPAKLAELGRRHPRVDWTVRLHSDAPFLAGEGMAIDWITQYLDLPKVSVAANSAHLHDVLRQLYPRHANQLDYLPNIYEWDGHQARRERHREALHIGCFGAIRPMKNHLAQAMAAVLFAAEMGRPLVFHINAGRVEGGAEPVLRNVRALFSSTPGTSLVEHAWMGHDEFLRVVSRMDIGMQVSFSETFNIVAADCISQGVPCVGSPEIPWLIREYQASPTSVDDMVCALHTALHAPSLARLAQRRLRQFSAASAQAWITSLCA